MTDEQLTATRLGLSTKVLHESERTRVTRVALPESFFSNDDGQGEVVEAGAEHVVVHKEPLGGEAPQRIRHELAILERLRGVPGVVQLVDLPGYTGYIVLTYLGGGTLADLAKPLAPDVLVDLGLALARAVAEMHRRGVMHRDISPANIVLSSSGEPYLIDFELASSLAEIRTEFTHHSEILGTLAYLAPEQTGRLGRAVDQRADLYGLGATLYELATGGPPFGFGDPLRLTHDHLARVPTPPAEINPAIPGRLSEIILNLLEKEPDSRYQTARGLAYDLERLQLARTDPSAAQFRVGTHDLPMRLVPPSRLVGRDREVATLRAAFEDAFMGRCRGVLVGGSPGVGKTALVDQLRPVVTSREGWFVAGKFDEFQRDLAFDGTYQAFSALGRLLLAEPEEELTKIRARLLRALGANAGLVTATLPEFASLLAVPPDPGDPQTTQVRQQRNAVEILRAVASRQRPVVVFVDDLQWANPTALGFFELALGSEQIEGLLLVGTYREEEVDTAHPLTKLLSRAVDQGPVRHIRLDNLSEVSLDVMVAEVLHVDPAEAVDLGGMINLHTRGNPYETVELLESLRRDGLLTVTDDGWQWDADAVRAHLGRSEVAGLIEGRMALLPAPSRQLLETMACLGGRAEFTVLQTAVGEQTDEVERRLAPAFDEGVLVVEPGAPPAVRFRHDRVREAVLHGLDPQRLSDLRLAIARRFATRPEFFSLAAEQYLPVVDAVHQDAERRVTAALLRHAADQAGLIGQHALMHALLTASLRLIDPTETDTLITVHTGRHRALSSLGRLEEADRAYRTIAGLCTSAAQRVDATCVQVRSLIHRNQTAEAIELGLESLRECGITVPSPDELCAELDRQFDRLYWWLDQSDLAEDLARPVLTKPSLLAAARLINVTLTATYFSGNLAMLGWLALEAVGTWIEHGPSRALVGAISHIGLAGVALRDDHTVGYRTMRRILPMGESRGWEPEISHARFVFTLQGWSFEPLEDSIESFRRARRGLIAGGDLANASYSYSTAIALEIECVPSLQSLVSVIDEGLAFARGIGNELTAQVLGTFEWLVRVLRGDNTVSPTEPIPRGADTTRALLFGHIVRAIAAAVFGDADALERHTAAAIPLLSSATALYYTGLSRFLRAMALAHRARAASGDERAALLSELDEAARWLAARAAIVPDNFVHLVQLVEAERAWAVGDFQSALVSYDAARRRGRGRQRPWHRALIAERAARFYLAHGAEHAGNYLLTQARLEYAEWGATAKVAQLDWAYPALRPRSEVPDTNDGRREMVTTRPTITTGTLDLLGILSVSQALSSETSIRHLHTRVVTVLSSMTGATGVDLFLWDADQREWLVPASGGDSGAVVFPKEEDVPGSVLRYVERTGEPLVVEDAPRDDRFSRDPYFAEFTRCALLAVPVFSRGELRAVLVLQNSLIRGAFTPERLDAVTLVAGQLAVSLDNVQLYAELTTSRARIVAAADQTRQRIERDLHDGAQQRLISLALRARALQATVPPEAAELTDGLAALAAEATSALNDLRELARGIHPVALTEGGLRTAIKALARRSPVPVRLGELTEQRLPQQIEIAVYYLVAEAMTNTAKHAEASAVTISVEVADSVVRVSVSDDGLGGANPAEGSGLVGLKDRVEALGGRLSVKSALGAGTTVQADLPLSPSVPG